MLQQPQAVEYEVSVQPSAAMISQKCIVQAKLWRFWWKLTLDLMALQAAAELSNPANRICRGGKAVPGMYTEIS